MEINQITHTRYTTKSFDPNKKLSPSQFEKVKDLLRMSPSSTNLQPWHFIIAETEEGKQRIAKGTQGMYNFNESKVLDASQVVLFCSKNTMEDDYILKVTDVEERDGRYPDAQIKANSIAGRKMGAKIHKNELKDLPEWLQKQVYLNAGFFLLGVAEMGLDACPMEGFDASILNKEFGLDEKELTAVLAIAIGFHTNDDFNLPAITPKSRLPENEIITMI